MKELIISGKTQVCGIIGDPVEHTISPSMHNAAFQATGLDYVYVPFNVKRGDLAKAINGVRALKIRGINVTIPHKVAVMSFLDEVDQMASSIGAINTVVNENGFLKGYNTDAAGFLRALMEEKVNPAGKRVVILGAGGASRAISFILADKGAKLTIVNRHLEAARELTSRILRVFRKDVKIFELSKQNLKTSLEDADILVNTTSVGMSPEDRETPVPASLIRPGLVVFDIIYSPLKTRLIADSAKRGAKVVGGLEMLVRQGAAAFELWTGKEPPVAVMREAAHKAL